MKSDRENEEEEEEEEPLLKVNTAENLRPCGLRNGYVSLLTVTPKRKMNQNCQNQNQSSTGYKFNEVFFFFNYTV